MAIAHQYGTVHIDVFQQMVAMQQDALAKQILHGGIPARGFRIGPFEKRVFGNLPLLVAVHHLAMGLVAFHERTVGGSPLCSHPFAPLLIGFHYVLVLIPIGTAHQTNGQHARNQQIAPMEHPLATGKPCRQGWLHAVGKRHARRDEQQNSRQPGRHRPFFFQVFTAHIQRQQ